MKKANIYRGCTVYFYKKNQVSYAALQQRNITEDKANKSIVAVNYCVQPHNFSWAIYINYEA